MVFFPHSVMDRATSRFDLDQFMSARAHLPLWQVAAGNDSLREN